LWPSARNMAATVEESTPPDMATAMVLFSLLNISGLSVFLPPRKRFVGLATLRLTVQTGFS